MDQLTWGKMALVSAHSTRQTSSGLMGALEDLMLSLSWQVRYLKGGAESRGEEEGNV